MLFRTSESTPQCVVRHSSFGVTAWGHFGTTRFVIGLHDFQLKSASDARCTEWIRGTSCHKDQIILWRDGLKWEKGINVPRLQHMDVIRHLLHIKKPMQKRIRNYRCPQTVRGKTILWLWCSFLITYALLCIMWMNSSLFQHLSCWQRPLVVVFDSGNVHLQLRSYITIVDQQKSEIIIRRDATYNVETNSERVHSTMNSSLSVSSVFLKTI